MNIIGIMLDSLRQDHVSFYNGGQPVFEDVPACQTPNLDDFARECSSSPDSARCPTGRGSR